MTPAELELLRELEQLLADGQTAEALRLVRGCLKQAAQRDRAVARRREQARLRKPD